MFHDELVRATEPDRAQLLAAPIIQAALRGEVTRGQYIDFLTQAYHHVRHTVPLLMGCGARLPERHAWLQRALADYIQEEAGHDDWILSDIDCAGGDSRQVRAAAPNLATEIMVAYAYDTVQRRNPLGFFGMAFVLEGTSVQLATRAAETLQGALGLPAGAFTYLASHGTLDIEHSATFAGLVNRFDRAEDQRSVIDAARAFFRLYGDIFRGLS
ncbi:MAG: iron-containing redox enzyme family protein [Rhodospirillaceae bacterium]|nr:iron-containing redox enzyme family protein [Rhodospirillaceae bacterium]